MYGTLNGTSTLQKNYKGGSIRMYMQSSVLSVNNSSAVAVVSCSTLNSYFGVSNCGSSNTNFIVSNGDTSSTGSMQVFGAGLFNNTWHAIFDRAFTGNVRVNWIAFYTG